MDSSDLFDDDMLEGSSVEYNPIRGIKNKIPLVEKYRPRKLDEIVQQEKVVKVLKECLKTGKLQHTLFYGPPGTGKTSSILAFVMELFGPKIYHKRVIELNASDERGIGVVRNKILTFAKSAIGNPDPNYPSPPYKIIILDEADAMTAEAQSALRADMEKLSNITRFCFICNYINKIQEPIASRCMKFRFKIINNITMNIKLRDIANKEKFNVDESVLDIISEVAKGDIRNGIIILQSIKYIYDYKKKITLEDVYDAINYLPPQVIINLWDNIITQNTCLISDVKAHVIELKQKGYSLNTFLDKLAQYIIKNNILTNKQKSIIAIMISKTEKRLLNGADEYIQLLNVISSIKGIYNGNLSNIDLSFC